MLNIELSVVRSSTMQHLLKQQ